MRLGIIGLGAMGAEMLRVAAGHPRFEVVAAADLDPAAVDRSRSGYPGIRFTGDPAEIVASADLDAVYIATPPATHADLVVPILRAGRSVLCEKPLAITTADGRRMVEAAASSGGAAAVNFALSDRHATIHLEQVLAAAGDLLAVEIRLAFARWPRQFQAGAGWLDGRAQGGFVREVFSHFGYLTDRLVGPLEPVDVRLDHRPGDDTRSEVAAWGLLRAGGVPVQLAAVAGAAGPDSYEWIVRGTRRSYLLRDWDQLFVADGNGWRPVALAGERGSEASRLTLFADAITASHPPDLADFETAFRIQQVVESFHA